MTDSRDVAHRFRDAWTVDDPATATPELLPMRLARACVATLPADAAGVSLFDHEFRVPLGASDDTAAAAERMQFTHGEGPCLDATAQHGAVHLTLDQMAQRWPAFADDLAAHTPYRAIVSVPLRLRDGVTGALDLYFDDPADVATMTLTDVLTVTTQITDALVSAQQVTTEPADADADLTRPAWLLSPAVRNRTEVWIAMGMVMTARSLDASDALALLRSFAYGRDTVLDDIAHDMIEGRVSTDDITV